MSTGAARQVSVSDPRHQRRRSFGSLPPRRKGTPATPTRKEPSQERRRRVCIDGSVVRFLLTPIFPREVFRGHGGWGCHHSRQRHKGTPGSREGAFRWFRSSQSRARDHLNRLHRCQGPTAAPFREFCLNNHLQETVTVRNIEGLLSHVVALEELFGKRPNDVEEQRWRNELIRYATIPS